MSSRLPLCFLRLHTQVPAAVAAAQEAAEQQPLAKWVTQPDGSLELQTGHAVRHIAWHARGDYFASVAPSGNTQVGFGCGQGSQGPLQGFDLLRQGAGGRTVVVRVQLGFFPCCQVVQWVRAVGCLGALLGHR